MRVALAPSVCASLLGTHGVDCYVLHICTGAHGSATWDWDLFRPSQDNSWQDSPPKRHVTVMITIPRHGLSAQHPRLLRRIKDKQITSIGSPFVSARTSTRLNSTLIYPDPPTNNHHDLPSFLAYAERSGLDAKSTLYVGTHYEYTVAEVLSKYGFYLKRVGGHSDYGIDLLGTWTVPSSKEPLRVLAQCKAIARKSSPNLVRELEGAFVGAPVGWKGHGVLGVFVTEKPATKGVRDSLARSRWPMGFISCTREGHVQQMLWNRRAEEEGLEGLGVGMRHAGKDGESQLLMLWKGQRVVLEGVKRNRGIAPEGSAK